jgi:hypothetical protein
MHISGRELVSFKAALNEAAETYGLTPTSAALDVINLIKDHNKKGQLKRELSELNFHFGSIDRFDFVKQIQVIDDTIVFGALIRQLSSLQTFCTIM